MDSTAALYPELKTIDKRLSDLMAKEKVTESNRKHCMEFIESCRAKGLSESRVAFYSQRLPRIAGYFDKDFKLLSRAEIEKFIVSLHVGGWTRDAYVVTLQNLYRFIFNLETREPLPDCMKHIKRSKEPNKLTTADMLNEAEVESIIKNAKSIKARAFIAMLAYGGLRPGELRALKMKNVVFRNSLIEINITQGKNAKRQGPRVVPMVKGLQYVREWVEEHPTKSADSWFFTGKIPAEPLSFHQLTDPIEQAARAAGIRKHVNPYLFRHIRATELYNKLPAEVVGRILGHDPAMGRRYAHLNNSQLIDAVRELDGSGEKTEKDELIELMQQVFPGGDIKGALRMMREVKEVFDAADYAHSQKIKEGASAPIISKV